jgi:hypothetical protein
MTGRNNMKVRSKKGSLLISFPCLQGDECC